MTETSHYTIVAESSNPLRDGSAHNVTTIVLPPASNSSRKTLEKEEDMDGSYLVLMKIEPEVEAPALELMKEEVVEGDVMAYGWILSKVRRWKLKGFMSVLFHLFSYRRQIISSHGK